MIRAAGVVSSLVPRRMLLHWLRCLMTILPSNRWARSSSYPLIIVPVTVPLIMPVPL